MKLIHTGPIVSNRRVGPQLLGLGVLGAILLSANNASAQSQTTLVNFNSNNGAHPYAGLLTDANGNLFGTTSSGGSGYGTVFELAMTANGYSATPTTLVNFNNSNGASPYAALIADANGNLFGTTAAGGLGFGTVFNLAKTATGYAATPTTLASFHYGDGAGPLAELIADANGNLFGTTYGGFAAGTVFELAKTATGYANTPSTLVGFNNIDGATPYAGLLADANGNLFGTTHLGGLFGLGTVFEVA